MSTKTERREAILARLHAGAKLREVAEEFGVSPQAVHQLGRKYGWRFQPIPPNTCALEGCSQPTATHRNRFCSRECWQAEQRGRSGTDTVGERAYRLRAETELAWDQIADAMGRTTNPIWAAKDVAQRRGWPWPVPSGG